MEESSNKYTKENILSLQKPTENFLIGRESNIYDIRFKGFQLRNLITNEIYFSSYNGDKNEELQDYYADHELTYNFDSNILKTKTLGTNLTISVGTIVKNLDLVERHFINNKIIADYEFHFPVFLPNTENNVEIIYEVPKLTEESMKLLNIGEEIQAKSDTFIFVQNNLVIHRKASYVYSSQ